MTDLTEIAPSMISVLTLLGTAFAGFVGLLGVGKLLEMTLGRFFSKKDANEALHATNQGKQLDLDESFRESLIHRIDKLETRLEAMQLDINSQMKENATIKAENATLLAENEGLKRDVARMEVDLTKLRKDRRDSDITIAALRGELDALARLVTSNQAEAVAHQKTEVSTQNPFPVMIVEEEGK